MTRSSDWNQKQIEAVTVREPLQGLGMVETGKSPREMFPK